MPSGQMSTTYNIIDHATKHQRWVLRQLLLGEERIKKRLWESSAQDTILIANRRILPKSFWSYIEGAKIILGTGPGGKALSSVLGGLAVNGKLIIIGASDEPLELSPNFFFFGHRSVVGWLAGSSIDSEDTLSFSLSSGVRSMNQVFALESAAEAFDLMMNGKARFRAVLTTGN